MKLNFDAVPDTNPIGYVKPGFYKGVLKKKEVKEKDGKEFLQINFDLYDGTGKKAGTLVDFFRDLATQQISLYKLSRLLQALGITGLKGDIELKLIVNMIGLDKEVALEVGDNTYNGKTTSQIQVANSQCYWPVHMLPGLLAANAAPGAVVVPAAPQVQADIQPNAAEFPFDAADGRVPPAETATATGTFTAPGGDNY